MMLKASTPETAQPGAKYDDGTLPSALSSEEARALACNAEEPLQPVLQAPRAGALLRRLYACIKLGITEMSSSLCKTWALSLHHHREWSNK